MLYPSMSDLLKRIDSRYLLVNVVAHRAREVASKAEDVGEVLEKKPVSIALEEIATGAYSVNSKR